jgi:hypothetical protein
MSHEITILRGGRVERTLTLEPGTYSVGRSPSSDIVLADAEVSKSHAVLTLDSQGIGIQDRDSANGIFFQGRRIGEHRFSGDFEVCIGPFVLRESPPEKTGKTPARETGKGFRDRLRTLSVANIRISLFLLITLVMVLTILIGYRPMSRQVSELQRQEFLRTGILLTRYLAEMNRPFLEEGPIGRVRVSPVNQEDGVLYAYVLDAYGRIIAPHEQQGNFLDWDGLSAAFGNNQLVLADGPSQEKLIFYPIGYQNKVIGAAVTGYAFRQLAGRSRTGLGGTAVMLLVVLFIVSMVLTRFITRSFLKPLTAVNEEVEIAIKENRDRLVFSAPYPELAALVQNLNRLLVRRPDPGRAPRVPESSPAPAAAGFQGKGEPRACGNPAEEPPVGPDTAPALDPGEPWFLVDRDSFTLSGLSPALAALPWARECREGMHLIEAFDADFIQAVSRLMEARPGVRESVTVQERNVVLTRAEETGTPSRVLFRVSEPRT